MISGGNIYERGIKELKQLCVKRVTELELARDKYKQEQVTVSYLYNVKESAWYARLSLAVSLYNMRIAIWKSLYGGK